MVARLLQVEAVLIPEVAIIVIEKGSNRIGGSLEEHRHRCRVLILRPLQALRSSGIGILVVGEPGEIVDHTEAESLLVLCIGLERTR